MSVIPFTYRWIMRHVVPKMYNGKLEKSRQKVKDLSAENFKLKKDNREFRDRINVFKSTWEGWKIDYE